MSEAAGGAAEGGSRRRGGGSGRRRPRGGRRGSGARKGGEATTQEKPRGERTSRASTAVPVPESFIGQSKEGKICDIIKRGTEKFGFIYIGEGAHDVTPRIYFNFSEYKDASGLVPRKGYTVTFECLKDDKDRPYASNLVLTEEGKKEAEAREAKIAAQAAGGGSASAGAGEKREGGERTRRPKKEPAEVRTVKLKVTCEGKSGTKDVDARVGESIGKLKHIATGAWEAATSLNVFYKGEKLTKPVLAGLADGETIHLKEPAAEA